MTIQTMPNQLLITSYQDAVDLNINLDFITLLFKEIERTLKPMLKSPI
jgi:hypothetical protein